MNDTVIVTGITGQDGSHMVDYLLENTDYHVVGTARRLSVPNHDNIDHIDNERFKKVYFDLTDNESVQNIVEKYKPKYFINLAAQSFVAASWDIPVATWNANATGVLYILEAIRKFSPETRFYNAGTSEEFGDVQYSPQDEKHQLRPRSPYGAAKAAARHLVKVYRDSYDIYAVQGWLFNHEGTRRGEETGGRHYRPGALGLHDMPRLHGGMPRFHRACPEDRRHETIPHARGEPLLERGPGLLQEHGDQLQPLAADPLVEGRLGRGTRSPEAGRRR